MLIKNVILTAELEENIFEIEKKINLEGNKLVKALL